MLKLFGNDSDEREENKGSILDKLIDMLPSKNDIFPDEDAVMARLAATMQRADQRIAEFHELSKKIDKQLEREHFPYVPRK